MKRFHRLTVPERFDAVRPFEGKFVKVEYRIGNSSPFECVEYGILLGASWNRTNGNSTGDVVIQAPEGRVFRFGTPGFGLVRSRCQSIALVHVGSIEEVDA